MLSENVAAAAETFCELFSDFTGIFYTLLYVWRGCEAIQVPAVTVRRERNL
jgi:hypothetical protein